MGSVALLVAMVAALPTTRDVRMATYVGANGGICGEQSCALDPNIARVRHVRCQHGEERDAAACAYEIRTRGSARWEAANDTFYRDLATGRWYLDDNDEDDEKARR